ncbi:cytochrome d ubiquinol oxidase subunit II [Nitrospira moscoviensis]|uniref:Putative Cytochrome bd oxidase, subunit II n=1 Tax=Nitrospira moscoviensis TaxID=42253 RepID=A0A0K2GFL5_NITMO|nr:cytochrome d ubiquinol oxidase subunit II [Nitrospira moscoviensis]ALA59392.1 putative Cytochrome bd oxidase, subunit II [Nitrospira moscoviensis]
MSPELIIAGALLIALTVYLLTGGADYGAGVWYLFANGARAGAHRALIEQALAPIWETNHVWLILVLVLLFTAFPPAFSAIVVGLHIPLTLLLVGIVMRGAAFAFRYSDVPFGALHAQWERLFALASLLTPFWLGVVIGTTAGGLSAASGGFVATFVSPWLQVFPFLVGLLTVMMVAYLAAVYLAVEAEDNGLREDFRWRAIATGLAVSVLDETVLLAARHGAPITWDALTGTAWGAVAQFATAAAGLAALVCLWQRRFRWARLCAAGQVTLTLWAWAFAQFPYLVPPSLTIYTAAAPALTLRWLLLALGAGALVLFPSLWYLFGLFKPRALFSHDGPPPSGDRTPEGRHG